MTAKPIHFLIVALWFYLIVLLLRPTQDKDAWLSECANRTHGSIESEPDCRFIGGPAEPMYHPLYTYVRTKSGKRIDFGDQYEPE